MGSMDFMTIWRHMSSTLSMMKTIKGNQKEGPSLMTVLLFILNKRKKYRTGCDILRNDEKAGHHDDKEDNCYSGGHP
ncbi:hypothetical protein ANABIO32_01900 [Rossellomorea marisflavi]|nr:hypothetical protein ANABIO32_01900 [Rossellomorea marisflavi]